MDLNDTMTFVAVARDRSFTLAGKRLALPKGTVSRRVARLEARLGVRLLERSTRRVSLTEIGRAYYERCSHAIEAIEDAERRAEDVSGKASGTLRVSCSYDFARDWLAPRLPAFRRRHPDLHLDIELSQRRVDLIAEGFDVAIRAGAGLEDSGLVARKLATSELGLYASPSYLERRGAPRTLADLAKHDTIVFARPRGAPGWRLVGPRGPQELSVTPWLATNEFAVLQRATVAGLGIGLLESNGVQKDVAAGRLERVLAQYGLSGGGLYAVYPSSHHLSPKVRVLVDFLVEHIGREAG